MDVAADAEQPGGRRRAAAPGIVDAGATGAARIETYTVLHDRDGAAHEAIVIARLRGRARVAREYRRDPDLFAALEREEMVGAPGGRLVCAPGRRGTRLASSAPDG